MSSSFLLLTLAMLINGTTNILTAGLFYERKVIQLTYVYYSVASLQIGLSLIVIPAFGIAGAAFSIMIAYILIPVGTYALARKYFSFDIDWARIFVISMICIPSVIYGLFLSDKYQFNYLIRIVYFTLIIYLIYLICFTKQERIEIKKIFNHPATM
jgi:O-antigen/teichoic acid export membrane protein